MKKIEAQQYRDNLAKKLKGVPKDERKQILNETKTSAEYQLSKELAKGEVDETIPRAEVNIFYMRHGKPEGKYAHGDMPYEEFRRAVMYDESINLKLSEEGKERVRNELRESGIEKHNIQLILASPYLRTQETAELVQEYLREKTGQDIPLKITDLLSEVRVDPDTLSKEEYESMLNEKGFWPVMEEFAKRWMQDENATAETAKETYARAALLLKYLRRVRRWTQYQKVFMVSHGWFGRVIKHVAQGGTPKGFEKETKLLAEAEMYALQHKGENQFIELNFRDEYNETKR
ncbi:histidine phosphatase family protein [Candidatus Kaiserbacteria bacterium]|nr:histidine phosphatase family protein [Candidatus Kaiserbacteria bacterium]